MNRNKMKLYAIDNPCFLADTFVFAVLDDDFCEGWSVNLGKTVWIKVNPRNKIEEFGFDISKRMHNVPLDDIIDNNVTFELPTGSARRTLLRMKKCEGEEFKKARQRGKFADVDFLSSNFSGY